MVIKNLDSDDFDDFISEGDSVVDFYADWCGPCKIMAPHFEKASNEVKKVKFGKLNVENEQEIAEKYGVRSIPTTIFFRDGEQIDRHTGALSFGEIKEFVKDTFD